MLASISRALEIRDATYGHGARVAALAEPVAVRLGWERERIKALRLAAPLHDIGKLKVRREVLGKAGPLTLDERAEIRHHPRAGASLVLPLRRAWNALPYLLFHHEHWDGSGYPAGLRGRSIPVEARILAVADAFDAMISPRPYRPALSHEVALSEIARCVDQLARLTPRSLEAVLRTRESAVSRVLRAVVSWSASRRLSLLSRPRMFWVRGRWFGVVVTRLRLRYAAAFAASSFEAVKGRS
jgi:HD-GYP domain-containing protein (c-di-GMP phosphodiesterase class II)